MCVYSAAQSCPTLCNPMYYSPPDSSVHGILQARILELVAILFSRGSSQPRHRIHLSCISCIDRWIFYHWATWGTQFVSYLRPKQRPGTLLRIISHQVCVWVKWIPIAFLKCLVRWAGGWGGGGRCVWAMLSCFSRLSHLHSTWQHFQSDSCSQFYFWQQTAWPQGLYNFSFLFFFPQHSTFPVHVNSVLIILAVSWERRQALHLLNQEWQSGFRSARSTKWFTLWN